MFCTCTRLILPVAIRASLDETRAVLDADDSTGELLTNVNGNRLFLRNVAYANVENLKENQDIKK